MSTTYDWTISFITGSGYAYFLDESQSPPVATQAYENDDLSPGDVLKIDDGVEIHLKHTTTWTENGGGSRDEYFVINNDEGDDELVFTLGVEQSGP